MIPRFWQETPTHAQLPFLLSLPLRHLDIIFQGHLFFFQVIFSFSHKVMWFFDDVGNSFSLFCNRIAKYDIICFTGTSSVSSIWKTWSKIPYMTLTWILQIQKLNLSSKMDISKTVWVNPSFDVWFVFMFENIKMFKWNLILTMQSNSSAL